MDAFPGIEAARIAWGKSVDGNASQLLTDPSEATAAEDEEQSSARDSAEGFLKDLLKDGPAPSKYVEAEAKEAGISWATVRRASNVLMVKKEKSNGKYYWSLPGISSLLKQVAQVAQPLNLEQAEQPGEQPAFLDPFDASQAFDAEVL